jgi:hypothetical protein
MSRRHRRSSKPLRLWLGAELEERVQSCACQPGGGPKQTAAPSTIVGGALVALMVMQIAKVIGSH